MSDRMLDRIRQSPVTGQIVRYGVAGGLITLAFAATYWAVATFGGVDPNLALAIVFVVFTGISYLVHGRYSFAGHGGRDRPNVRGARFAVVNVAGFLLNQFWVWWLVKELDGPVWWSTVPIVMVTPWLTFAAHRLWVYR
ncbi:MAG: GtrA family protein [Sphingomonadaceae bacterium]|nr:MAG: GtrA family protein [Sphingomonadaceae bacterium]